MSLTLNPESRNLFPGITGKSAGCPAFLPVGRGGEESRSCHHIEITRKPRPVPAVGRGGELHLPAVCNLSNSRTSHKS